MGTPAIREGVSLLRVRNIHIMEPYWNMSRMEQIIGRGIRYCSHKDMPSKERRVNVYLYHSVARNKTMLIDRYIYEMANDKNTLIQYFEQVLKESAVDCSLNKTANIDKKNPIKCYNK